jgi:hypothetical protein
MQRLVDALRGHDEPATAEGDFASQWGPDHPAAKDYPDGPPDVVGIVRDLVFWAAASIAADPDRPSPLDRKGRRDELLAAAVWTDVLHLSSLDSSERYDLRQSAGRLAVLLHEYDHKHGTAQADHGNLTRASLAYVRREWAARPTRPRQRANESGTDEGS